ncbi:Pyruvate dehydrogenase E1 component subunit alpha [Candidatus Clavichlamydia salmonicola]|uniref:thiamine pyrophosphate-dependent enzyme n=1 Tax=Candidatus Clavichlamydia salmonicola TaxID=469812 RepID=UPI00189120AA|nr:thiamine pyrophosphate-dependent enzyme [Candidatus Clavichlamydia salmonicola]MBF5051240.1 Pyruvate dehydrogenase E1 component subunit alpha [Candidatus Clavichlamydia salmonicola]
MKNAFKHANYNLFCSQDKIESQKRFKKISQELSSAVLIEDLKKMLLIRHFESQGENAYQQGFISGFYHSYAGQEAIQTALIRACGKSHWYATTYRCHALALLLDETPSSLMAELYGKVTGNALGRGGSMHMFSEKLLGGFGIVGGHLPLAIGAAFSIKYQEKKDLISIGILGDGAVAQGAFHESINLAALWDLPCLIIIENNHWGMGTHVSNALAKKPIDLAHSYDVEGIVLDGSDYSSCYDGFSYALKTIISTSRPMIVECLCDRFRGHSISDANLYRSKEEMENIMSNDPIILLKNFLEDHELLTAAMFKDLDQETRSIVRDAVKQAEDAPYPSISKIGDGVYA